MAVVVGIGLATAIYITADLSGAHLNPVFLCRSRDFCWKLLPIYLVAQVSFFLSFSFLSFFLSEP